MYKIFKTSEYYKREDLEKALNGFEEEGWTLITGWNQKHQIHLIFHKP